MTPTSSLDRGLRVRDSRARTIPGVWDMATIAARAPKRDLAPDWRDSLRASAKRLVLRVWGALLIGASFAGAIALASHSPNDPSLSTAAGGPASNWLGSGG